MCDYIYVIYTLAWNLLQYRSDRSWLLLRLLNVNVILFFFFLVYCSVCVILRSSRSPSDRSDPSGRRLYNTIYNQETMHKTIVVEWINISALENLTYFIMQRHNHYKNSKIQTRRRRAVHILTGCGYIVILQALFDWISKNDFRLGCLVVWSIVIACVYTVRKTIRWLSVVTR